MVCDRGIGREVVCREYGVVVVVVVGNPVIEGIGRDVDAKANTDAGIVSSCTHCMQVSTADWLNGGGGKRDERVCGFSGSMGWCL